MSKASTELLDMLSEFLLNEIGAKSLDGITYAFILKDKKSTEDYERYMAIRKEATKCGFSPDEVFRVYELMNGYIFDMDLLIAKQMTYRISVSVNKTNGNKTPVKDLIGNSPENRRKADMVGLAKFIKSEFDKGNREVDLALFSRNSTPKITITGLGQHNEPLAIRYNAYAIRHWDIETVNAKLLIPAKIRIAKIQPCEILPSKTGVKFKFFLEHVEDD